MNKSRIGLNRLSLTVLAVALVAAIFVQAFAEEAAPADLSVDVDAIEATAQGDVYTITELKLEGNAVLTDAEILASLPDEYLTDEADELSEAYDLRPIKAIIANPGAPTQVSARTVAGFTQYVISQYQVRNIAGVYVYVPKENVVGRGEMADDVLVVRVIEATASAVGVKAFDPNGDEKEKGYLRKSAVAAWSPAKPGQVVNRKKVDEFVNLLNENPDRYVAAVVSSGEEPNTLDLSYEMYEANPWHFFAQVDNSGPKDRQWAPRVGLINTDLFGIDDTFTLVYQARPDSTVTEDYALFGSYDFPIAGPRLRLNLFGGYSEFDVTSTTGGINFLGRGTFAGGDLRLNVLQHEKWFFDVLAGLLYQESRVSPSVFADSLTTDLELSMWHLGTELHRSKDLVDDSIKLDMYQSFNGSSNEEFQLARSGTSNDFALYTFNLMHSQYFAKDRIHRFTGKFQWIGSDGRVPPSNMTTYGGMYTVRGYDEDEIIADGGILASLQYEFDLVKYAQKRDGREPVEGKNKEFLRKLAPLAFFDYGQARNKGDLAANESRETQLYSVGGGLLMELGDNFVSGVFAGYPLKATDDTREGKGRLNVFFMLRY